MGHVRFAKVKGRVASGNRGEEAWGMEQGAWSMYASLKLRVALLKGTRNREQGTRGMERGARNKGHVRFAKIKVRVA